MSAAADVVRAALVLALKAQGELVGIAGLDAEAGAGSLPRLSVDVPEVGDWGTKTARGREVRTAVTLRVAHGQRLRLPGLVDAVEAAGVALNGNIGGWWIGSAVLLRSRVADQADGSRVATVEHRVRVLEN
ncbi:MAG: hypothetical protein JWO15_1667 [Sphingomonadales bacterium]|nr:hypothetical protein [Sphingomonadales bacterium]